MGPHKIQSVSRFIGRLFDRLPLWIFDLKVQLILDGVAGGAALLVAFLVRFEFRTSYWFPELLFWVPIIALVRPLMLLAMKGYRCTWRHFHISDGLVLALESSVLTVGLLAFRLFHSFGLSVQALPLSVAIIELNLFLVFAGAVRILRRLTYTPSHDGNERVYRTLLIADEGSVAGAVRLVDPYPDAQLVGIITDDDKMHGRTIAGVPILGGSDSLGGIIVAHEVELVLMTSGGVQPAEEIVTKAIEFGAQVRILPTARDLVRGRVRVSRSLRVEQVMGRHLGFKAKPHADVVSCLNQRCVLVTGAGGSIGSEISRQIAQLPVTKLVLLDHDESAIFEMMNELPSTGPEIIPCVGDIRDHGMLEELFSLHMPDAVLHAAAYKHVPIMESNACEAVLNNVTGTRQLIDTAEKFGCERFVMISTDKAVHPSSIMGATKRAAEVLVQDCAMRSANRSRTRFACVRFGNVIGSRGSVVPIFLRQIQAGGPVTITHELMTRYFMSISQAVQLVLQAATLASSGDVYMLDMGNPVKIVDFARKLIRMSGLRPDVDIPIRVIGARPGEKLHEQLWYEESEVSNTVFPHVFRVTAKNLPYDVADQIARLEKAAARRATCDEICSLLQSLPIDYLKLPTVPSASQNGSGRMETAAAAGD